MSLAAAFPVFVRSRNAPPPVERPDRQKSLLAMVKEKRLREDGEMGRLGIAGHQGASRFRNSSSRDTFLAFDRDQHLHTDGRGDDDERPPLWDLPFAPRCDAFGLTCVLGAQSITASLSAGCVAVKPKHAAPNPSMVPIAERFFRRALLPIQQHLVPTLRKGVPCVAVGPRGSGKRTAALYACGITADSVKASSPPTTTKRNNPTAIVVASCTEEQRWSRNQLEGAFGERITCSADNPTKGSSSMIVEGDVWITTAFHLCNLLERPSSDDASGAAYGPAVDASDESSDLMTNFDEVRLVVVFGAERLLMPPLADRMTGSMWRQLRTRLHPSAALCVMGCMEGPTSEAAEIIMHGVSPPIAQLHVHDATAWLDVIHEVHYVEQEIQPTFVRDVLRRTRSRAVLVVQTKGDVDKWVDQLQREGMAAVSEVKSFSDGRDEVLVLSDFAIAQTFAVPAHIDLVINVSLPRRDFEEKLTYRARALLTLRARSEHLCRMLTFVNHQSCPVVVAARLREFLIATHQTVPSVLDRLRVRSGGNGSSSTVPSTH